MSIQHQTPCQMAWSSSRIFVVAINMKSAADGTVKSLSTCLSPPTKGKAE